MKRVWVLRHGKAEESDDGPDSERPLARRGRRQGPVVGRWLAAHGGPPDLVVSSPARRALETARLVANASGYRGEVLEWPLLYPGDAGVSLEALRGLDDSLQSVLLVGHNPHAEQLVALLSGGSRVRMPTASLALLETEADQWRSLRKAGMALALLIASEMT